MFIDKKERHTKLNQIRGGHRGHVSRLLANVNDVIHGPIEDVRVLHVPLKAKFELITKYDEDILELTTN